MYRIEQKYNRLKNTPSDINEHLSTLKRYAEQCNHITEMGVRWIVSTWALLAAHPKRMVSIDIVHPAEYGGDLAFVYYLTVLEKIDFNFKKEDTTANEIEETDLLFIDTLHEYSQLKAELLLHAKKVNKYIILHDTKTFGEKGERGGEGLQKAIDEFLLANTQWKVKEVFENNNGLTVLERTKL